MKAHDPNTTNTTSDQLELDLQEALAQRQRAAELFGAPDWDGELDTLELEADEADEDD